MEQKSKPPNNLPSKSETPPSTKKGLYHRYYSTQEVADLDAQKIMNNANSSLNDEISAARLALHRIFDLLQQNQDQLSLSDYQMTLRLIFDGTNTIARLLRTQKMIATGQDDLFRQSIYAALEEMHEERKSMQEKNELEEFISDPLLSDGLDS